MSHTFTKMWVHAVWSTKNRNPLIRPHIEDLLYKQIRQQIDALGCLTSIINGMPDHIHCLFRLSPLISIADIIKQTKGSSSHFINQEDLIPEKFAWQTGYSAFTVSDFHAKTVYNYILTQKEHHRQYSYENKVNQLWLKHRLHIKEGDYLLPV
ncbi:MAG: hypothetical protein RIQ62_878 [Bacteroidota bacterium]